MTTEIHCDQYINELVEDTIEYVFDSFNSIESVYDIKQLIKGFLGNEYLLTIDEMGAMVYTSVDHKMAVIQKIQWLSEFQFNFLRGKFFFVLT